MLFIGGVIGVIPFPAFEGGGKLAFYGYYWAAIYSVVVGLFVMIIEYPRGKRRKGTVVERRSVIQSLILQIYFRQYSSFSDQASQ